MIRVAVVDDHVVVRMGLRHLIASCPDLEFCGEFGGGKGAVDFVSSVQPDVTLMDVRMPDMSGVEALREIITANPKARVVMLTTSDTEEDVYQSIEEGALGYIMKESPVEDIISAVRSAMAGEVFMSDDVRRIYETRKSAKGLSPRESEVLLCVSRGQNNRQIGECLGISENSVKMHLKRIFFKLGATDRTEAVDIAVRRGFLSRS